MSPKLTLKASKRTVFGRKVKSLRRQGIIPANIFGKNLKSSSIQLIAADFQKIFEQAGETTLIQLKLESETKSMPVLITSAQMHPVTGAILHVDLHHVDLKEKVTANIPLELTNEAPVVKEQGGVVVQVVSEVEVEALPGDLPEKFELDLSKLLNIGDSITLADLKFNRDLITLNVPEETTIVTAQAPKEEVVEEESTQAAEAETTVQANPNETSEASGETSENKA